MKQHSQLNFGYLSYTSKGWKWALSTHLFCAWIVYACVFLRVLGGRLSLLGWSYQGMLKPGRGAVWCCTACFKTTYALRGWCLELNISKKSRHCWKRIWFRLFRELWKVKRSSESVRRCFDWLQAVFRSTLRQCGLSHAASWRGSLCHVGIMAEGQWGSRENVAPCWDLPSKKAVWSFGLC